MIQLSIRQGLHSDSAIIADMLKYLADTLGGGEIHRSDEKIIQRNGFGPDPLFSTQIAHIDSNPVGLALYLPYFSTTLGAAGVYVQDLWVAPTQRGVNLGQKLLAAVADHAANNWSAEFMKLAVYADNPDARRFYDRNGFTGNANEQPLMLAGSAFEEMRSARKP